MFCWNSTQLGNISVTEHWILPPILCRFFSIRRAYISPGWRFPDLTTGQESGMQLFPVHLPFLVECSLHYFTLTNMFIMLKFNKFLQLISSWVTTPFLSQRIWRIVSPVQEQQLPNERNNKWSHSPLAQTPLGGNIWHPKSGSTGGEWIRGKAQGEHSPQPQN